MGSLPFKRGGDGEGLLLGLLRHEVGGGLLRLGRRRELLCVLDEQFLRLVGCSSVRVKRKLEA